VALIYSWEGRAYAQFYTLIGFGILACYLLRKLGYIGPFSNLESHVRYALRFGIPLIPTAVGRMLLITADRLLITNMIGKESAAIYTIALQFAMVINIIGDSFNNAFVPWLYERLKSNANQKLIKKLTYSYFFLIVIIAILYGLSAEIIMPYILGPSYIQSGRMIIFFSIGYAFSGCYLMVVNYISYANKNEYLIFVVLASGLFNIPLLYFMIKGYGLDGAMYSFLISKLHK
jgi:O-antigen/teichoic acid export membrane protein